MSTDAPEQQKIETGKIVIKDILDAGVHFGHKAARWNPKMRLTSTVAATISTSSISKKQFAACCELVNTLKKSLLKVR